jgi:hypothetical protein
MMISKILSLAAASTVLMALSTAAVASTSSVQHRHYAAQAPSRAFDFAALAPAAQTDAYHYHGGPKSNSTIDIQ